MRIRPGRLVVGVCLLTVVSAACAGPSGSPSPTAPTGDAAASAVVSSLGQAPIASVPAVEPTPTAAVGAPQLLAMGATTLVVLGTGKAVVTALGPEQERTGPQPAGPDATTPATITLRVSGQQGRIAVDAGDLFCRNESGEEIPLTTVGAAQASVGPGAIGEVRVRGVFASGAVALTWRPAGQPVATWDFTIELD